MTDSNIILSEDLLDILECDLEDYEEENNLSKKISKHSNLTKKVNELEETINNFIDIIDNIDEIEVECINDEEFSKTIEDIENMISNLDNEDCTGKLIEEYQKIHNKIRYAKEKCEETSLSITKIN